MTCSIRCRPYLAETAAERDQVLADAQAALEAAKEMQLELALMEEKNDQIFRQLEDAMTISVDPLEKDVPGRLAWTLSRCLEQVRRGYNGQGGPLMPLSFLYKGWRADQRNDPSKPPVGSYG